jgi:tetratricopeptide (TPR) repeat protein
VRFVPFQLHRRDERLCRGQDAMVLRKWPRRMRARLLCRQLGETPQLFLVLHGLRRFYSMQDDQQTARELGEELVRLAQQQRDPALLREAHQALGMACFFLGDLATAREQYLQGSALCEAPPDLAHVLRYGQDGGVLCLSYGGFTLWLLGFPDQALQWSQRAVALTQHHPHPFVRTMALTEAAHIAQRRREPQATQAYAEAASALAREHGFPMWEALGLAPQGWALAEQGHSSAGIALIRQGLAEYRATESRVSVAHVVAMLAESYLRLGQAEDGLALVTETLAGELDPGYFFQGELRRLKGEFLSLLATRASATRPARCWQTCTAGSPKALIPRTCARPGRCWKSVTAYIDANRVT